MPSDSSIPDRFRFFVISCRDPKSDFRLSLVDALRQKYEVYYISLWPRPSLWGPTENDAVRRISMLGLVRFLARRGSKDRTNVYFNSTDTNFPVLTTMLRIFAVPGLWCLDMHGDLLYGKAGFKRRRDSLVISLLSRLSHLTVHAPPALHGLFPASQHLGNASGILPLPGDDKQDRAVLVIADFDERFDFDFLADLARFCPGVHFHLHGGVLPDDIETKVQITSIDVRHSNIHFHGRYEVDDLPAILSRYSIAVAPFKTETPSTRYIDPLQTYHCLNGGLEVVSTDIPQARHLENWVHVVADAAACANALTAIQSRTLAKQPNYTPITWDQRADRLARILREHEKN